MRSGTAGVDKTELFEDAVRNNHKMLRAFFCAAGVPHHEAADLTQETFLTAFRRLDSFDAERPAGPWLRGIARFKYMERLRKKRAEPEAQGLWDEADRECAFFEDKGLEGDGIFSALEVCLQKAGPGTEKLLRAYYQDSKSCRETADFMGLEEITVRKRLQRAREALRDCITKDLGEIS
jgi:RNA polymerase sigma-70 factor (ECF subfamily)